MLNDMAELAKLHFPPKLNYSLDQLKLENEAKYYVVLVTLERVASAFYDGDEEGISLFMKHAEALIGNGMFLPEVNEENDEYRVRFKLWSYFSNSFKLYDEMNESELDIHAAMLERYRMVN